MSGLRLTLGVRNAGAVKANLRQYGEGARARAKVVVTESADRVYGTAQDLCPVKTGFMKSQMRKEVTPGGFSYQVGFLHDDFAAAGFADYFKFTEFGTRFMPAQPCIFPARDLHQPRFRRDLAEALRPR